MVAISRERRRHTERMIRGEGVATDPRLSDDERLIYAVSCLVCDETGRLTRATLGEAMHSPSILEMAIKILIKCGAMPGSGVN